MKYLVSCDLDGTLLTDDKQISKKSRKIIRKFVKQGNYFVINTGRAIISTLRFLSDLKLDMPIITDNGGNIYHFKNNIIEVEGKNIPYKEFKEFVTEVSDYINCAFCIKNNIVICQNKKDVPFWIFPKDDSIVIHEGLFKDLVYDDVTLPSLWIKNECIEEFEKACEKYSDVMGYHKWGIYDNQCSYELFNPYASKGNAMKDLAKRFGCDKTIAFGDQLNDLSMLKAADYGVAMCNARDEVKNAAGYTTKYDNNNDGVAMFLKDLKENSYQKFSYYYDEIMELIEYDTWVDFVKPFLDKSSSILDLACGSGTFAISLANQGYKIKGLDLSKEIIDVAKEKSIMNHTNIKFDVKDMTNFKYDEKFDVITCFFDSVNFLNKEEIKKMYDSVYDHLNEGGLFIFDIFTKSKINAFKNLTIKDNLSFAKYKWNMKVKNNTIFHTIKIVDGKTKIVESYHEYYHELEEILDNRFKVKSLTSDFKPNHYDPINDERILVVLEK